ncbi:hypothetical protein CRV24_009338 [Beauveria bassiana]|nr:hypothetical protein CRV24_009338 [Beauveria bassiana]KAH8707276.1 hypothetical protein HC256_010553 [Beauveria bassiana]
MGKGKLKIEHKLNGNSTSAPPTTTSAVAADPILGFKMRLLIHDFINVEKDANAARRINSTTHPHYISLPYFDQQQADAVKAAIVDTISAVEQEQEQGQGQEHLAVLANISSQQGQRFEAALGVFFQNFFDKRRASGDARPCGPHNLAPVYALLFGIDKKELDSPQFQSRIRKERI